MPSKQHDVKRKPHPKQPPTKPLCTPTTHDLPTFPRSTTGTFSRPQRTHPSPKSRSPDSPAPRTPRHPPPAQRCDFFSTTNHNAPTPPQQPQPSNKINREAGRTKTEQPATKLARAPAPQGLPKPPKPPQAIGNGPPRTAYRTTPIERPTETTANPPLPPCIHWPVSTGLYPLACIHWRTTPGGFVKRVHEDRHSRGARRDHRPNP